MGVVPMFSHGHIQRDEKNKWCHTIQESWQGKRDRFCKMIVDEIMRDCDGGAENFDTDDIDFREVEFDDPTDSILWPNMLSREI